ncbi:MAG: hypothetical protein BGN99_30125 [Alphaproteobacteria bacterium 65-37]|jgi:hypothetical protein|nr:MAG: hypothetical protein BGN99_30125 [Alphaproteobacteria bacterium 65-37]
MFDSDKLTQPPLLRPSQAAGSFAKRPRLQSGGGATGTRAIMGKTISGQVNDAATAPCDVEVEEVLTEHDTLVVLSLGFASAHDPLDVLHIVCGRHRSGREPPPLEDELYIERSDQSLACDGRDVIHLAGHSNHIELALSDAGMSALALPHCTRFRFDTHPELLPIARHQLAAMIRAGQPKVSLQEE